MLVIFGGSAAYQAFTSADRDESGVVVDAGTLDWDALQVGDCALMPTEDEVEDLQIVPCGDSHHLETFLIADHPAGLDADFPAEQDLDAWAADACYAAFEPYVGISYEDAVTLDFMYFSPTASAWDNGDRGVVCMVGTMDGEPVLGTVAHPPGA